MQWCFVLDWDFSWLQMEVVEERNVARGRGQFPNSIQSNRPYGRGKWGVVSLKCKACVEVCEEGGGGRILGQLEAESKFECLLEVDSYCEFAAGREGDRRGLVIPFGG